MNRTILLVEDTLDLAIVKELSEAMGGSVAVESKSGQGSVFTVKLPGV
jgi:signal transduction histidine kinase